MLAGIAGVTSGLQNMVFIVVMQHNEATLAQVNSFWVWPPFLLAAALPMFIGFWYQARHHHKAIHWFRLKDLALVVLMGLLFTGSLVLYSTGMSKLGQQDVIGWPTFMIAIILTSQLWNQRYKEVLLTTAVWLNLK
jgi:L-rhamnose-H+ transport protein